MKIELVIPAASIADLMTTAIESGDPVTTAARGGWCDGVYWKSKGAEPPPGCWYNEPKTWNGNFRLEVIEVDDESTGHKTSHFIGRRHVREGLVVMAKEFPNSFAQILSNEIDAPCADIFLQCVLFGDERYA